ncbi:MAG: hypothetical protein Q9172_003210 [Xanthocarpia lactea]
MEQQNPLPSLCSTLCTPESSPHIPHMKRQKLCKDEATFVKGKPQIEVNYWPWEYQDEKAAAEHRKYKVFPIGQIAEYCKHVPYRSEKKSFLSKTGLEGFHDNAREDARKESRTEGGYWMPFEAAKAVAATFCYRIRYVLTPIFGLDFPAQCIPPGSLGFESMHVAPKIVRECVEAARKSHRLRQGPRIESRPETPLSAGARCWTATNIRPEPLKLDSENGYGTDTDPSDSYVYSPQKSVRCRFKGLATPRSSGMPGQYEQSYVRAYAPSQTGSESDSSNECRKRKRNPPRRTPGKYDSSSSDLLEDSLTETPPKAEEMIYARAVAKDTAAKALLELKMEAKVFERKGRMTEWRRASA